jgi:hypothetical protein
MTHRAPLRPLHRHITPHLVVTATPEPPRLAAGSTPVAYPWPVRGVNSRALTRPGPGAGARPRFCRERHGALADVARSRPSIAVIPHSRKLSPPGGHEMVLLASESSPRRSCWSGEGRRQSEYEPLSRAELSALQSVPRACPTRGRSCSLETVDHALETVDHGSPVRPSTLCQEQREHIPSPICTSHLTLARRWHPRDACDSCQLRGLRPDTRRRCDHEEPQRRAARSTAADAYHGEDLARQLHSAEHRRAQRVVVVRK